MTLSRERYRGTLRSHFASDSMFYPLTMCALQIVFIITCSEEGSIRLQFDRATNAAFGFQRKLPGVSIRQSSDSECQQTASSLTIVVIDRLLVTMTSYQVRRARLSLCWSVCVVEDIRAESDIANFRKLLKTIILVLRSVFDNCILPMYTV